MPEHLAIETLPPRRQQTFYPRLPLPPHRQVNFRRHFPLPTFRHAASSVNLSAKLTNNPQFQPPSRFLQNHLHLKPILAVFTLQRPQFDDFCVILQRIPKRVQDILLDSLTITTWKEQTPIIGTATHTGATFPYIGVACGEPWDVWRKSAPFGLKRINKLKHQWYEILFYNNCCVDDIDIICANYKY